MEKHFCSNLLSAGISRIVIKTWILVLLLFVSSTLTAQTVDFAYGTYQNAPYVFVDNTGKMNKGIMFDISQEISGQLSQPVQLINLPRKRTEEFLLDGRVDMRCHLSPLWVEHPEAYIWTAPLYQLNTIIVGPKSHLENLTSIEELNGKTVGGVMGYRYNHEINQLVQNGSVNIVESKSLRIALLMLSKGRVDYVIGNHILANYLVNDLQLENQLIIHPLVIRTQSIHCAISKQSNISANIIIEVLENMKTAGGFEIIFQKYFKNLEPN